MRPVQRGDRAARSRGFKFALISGIRGISRRKQEEIIVPESGQGAIGPALVNVGHAYPDYRNHPLFTMRMERLSPVRFSDKQIRFVFPRLMAHEGRNLGSLHHCPGETHWETTRSCWRSSRWSSLNGTLRQCGVCAACKYERRLSVHAAGLTEPPNTYVCTNMSAINLDDEARNKAFTRKTRVFSGVRHRGRVALGSSGRHGQLRCGAVGREGTQCSLAPAVGIPAGASGEII